MLSELTESVVATIQSAARKLTAFGRRQFQAEMAVKYCAGDPRRAETIFGWGRDAVATGLGELRSGLRCLDNFSARGRHKSEERDPELARAIQALVDPASQADPKFQTPLAYTRVTAAAVHEQLAAGRTDEALPLPSERTMYNILNRMGYCLRRVRKTAPQKKSPKPTPSSTTSTRSTRGAPAKPKPCAFRSIPRPK